MPEFEQLLVRPPRGALAQALLEAVVSANGKGRLRILTWPLPDDPATLAEGAGPTEGWRQWNGAGGRGGSSGSRTAVGLAWWTDHAGGRHFRVVGRRGHFDRPRLNHLLDPDGDGWPALALVYPERVLLAGPRGQRSLVAVCACGSWGPPGQLAWMGDCCGPCHDRREEGLEPPRVWPDPGTTTLSGWGWLACSPDGRTLSTGTGTGDGRIRLWDVFGGRERFTLPEQADEYSGARDQLTSLAFCPDGRHAVTVSARGRIGRWHVETGAYETLFREPVRGSPMALSPDGSLIALARAGGVSVRELLSGQVRHDRIGSLRGPLSLAFSPDGKMLAGGSWEGTVRLWDVDTGAELAGPVPPDRGAVRSLSFSPDGRTLAVAWRSSHWAGGHRLPVPVQLWDLARGAVRCSLVVAADSCAAFAPDGRALVTGSEDRVLRLWDPATGAERLTLQWHRAPIRDLTFSADGTMLATAGTDGTVKVWPWEALRPAPR